VAKKYDIPRRDEQHIEHTQVWDFLPAETINASRPSNLDWLAKKQGLEKAAIPIHTEEERKLFYNLMNENESLMDRKSINWSNICQRWSEAVTPENEIFYKLPEHLLSFWKGVKERSVITTTLNEHAYSTECVKRHLDSRNLSSSAPSFPLPGYPTVAQASEADTANSIQVPVISTEATHEFQFIAASTLQKRKRKTNCKFESGFYVYNPETKKSTFKKYNQ
jgi:hypothetical protein